MAQGAITQFGSELTRWASPTINPDICNGKPVVRNTRITVQTVLEFLAAGDSAEDVLEEYPALKREDVQACLDYASKLMANHYSVVALR